MEAKPDVALRKRQQITRANRMMFLWVIGVSVVVGIAGVLCLFLGQKILYNEKVIAKKNETAGILTRNNAAVSELKQNALLLNTNQALLDVPKSDRDLLDEPKSEKERALQVILDALPSQANSSALGSSLQNVLIPSSIKLESLKVEPSPAEIAAQTASGSAQTPPVEGQSANAIAFTFAVRSSNPNALRDLLRRLEKSIRPINVQSVNIAGQGTETTLSITAVAYYEPPVTTELKTEEVPV